MSSAPSNVKGAAAWLVTQLQASVTAVSGYTLWVDYGEPIGTEPDDQVFLIDVESTSQMLAMGTVATGVPLLEQITFPVKVSVVRVDDTGQATFERCADLVNAVLSVVRADRTLGGNVQNAQPERVTYPSPAATENGTGRICETEIAVVATATY